MYAQNHISQLCDLLQWSKGGEDKLRAGKVDAVRAAPCSILWIFNTPLTESSSLGSIDVKIAKKHLFVISTVDTPNYQLGADVLPSVWSSVSEHNM